MAITTPQGIDLQAPEALELKTIKASIAERDAISLVTRYVGLKVFTEDTGLNYQLKGGIQNSDWSQFGDPLDFDLFYTKVNMQTSGEASLHWDNLTNIPDPDWIRGPGIAGDKLTAAPDVKEVFLEDNLSGLTTISVKNTNDISGYSASMFVAKGSGPDYTNTMFFGVFSASYDVTSWAGNGVLTTDRDMVISAVTPGSDITFQVGGGWADPTPVFNIASSGLLNTLVPGYETLVLADNDIPNKKYVDDGLANIGTSWGDIAGSISNQFDLQNELNSKKNNFIENNAFNKSFGTIAGSVAAGDHNHIEADITDLDKYSQTYIDNLISLYYTKINLQVSGQSQVHWNNITNTPSFTTSFSALVDTPSDYVGSAGKSAVVNLTETGLEFITPTNTLLDLTDTPVDYTGSGLKTLRVNAGETAVEFANSAYFVTVGTNGDYATISEALTALEYNMKLVSNITEIANINLIAETIIDSSIYSIDMGVNTFTITGDGISLRDMKLLTGTITIDATADKSIITNCRTQVSIIDNGTNSIIQGNQLI